MICRTAGAVREEATLCEEEGRKRAAREARFAAAPKDQTADARTAATRRAWPGGTMTVIMPGQQPRTIVTQGGVPMAVVGDKDESDGSRTTPAAVETELTKESTEVPPRERPELTAGAPPTEQPRRPRHTETAVRRDRRSDGGVGASEASARGEREETARQRSPPKRGAKVSDKHRRDDFHDAA